MRTLAVLQKYEIHQIYVNAKLSLYTKFTLFSKLGSQKLLILHILRNLQNYTNFIICTYIL